MRKADPKPEKCFFRTGDRFTSHNGKWWFSVREGADQGPFESREAAELALKRYIDGAEHLDHMKDRDEPVEQPKPEPTPLSIDLSY